MSSVKQRDTTQGGQPSDVPGGHPARLFETVTIPPLCCEKGPIFVNGIEIEWVPVFNSEVELDEEITIPRDQLKRLLELAVDAIVTIEEEYSGYPTNEDCDLMTKMHNLVGNTIPDDLELAMSRTRKFITTSEVEPDGREVQRGD